MEAAVPRPLRSGEEGPKARRAPLPEAVPPAGLRAGTDAPEDAETPAPANAPPNAAAAAFDALGDAVTPGSGDERGDPREDAPSGADDFTWDPPPGRPQGGAPSGH